jgi:hypothetical protein
LNPYSVRIPKNKLACPCRRELTRTGQSQAAGAPIGGLIDATTCGANRDSKLVAAGTDSQLYWVKNLKTACV